MREGTKLWTSLVSPKQLNIELSICEGDEPDCLFPLAILVEIEDLDWLSLLSLWNKESLRASSFPILLNTEGCCCDIDGYNLSNTDALELDVGQSPPSLLASFIMMYYTSNGSSLRRLKIFTSSDGT